MKNISNDFNKYYQPQKAFVIFLEQHKGNDLYVESYDFDVEGRMCNAHPLTAKESIALAESLKESNQSEYTFLQPKKLLPITFCIWRTGRMAVQYGTRLNAK